MEKCAEYPALEQLKVCSSRLSAVRDFLSFVADKGMALQDCHDERICLGDQQLEDLLREFAGVDSKEVESERRTLAEQINKGEARAILRTKR